MSDGVATTESRVRAIGAGLGLVALAFGLGFVTVLLILSALVAAGVELTPTTQLFVSLIGIQGVGFPVTAYLYLSRTGRLNRSFIPVRWPSLREVGLALASAIGALILVSVTAAALLSVLETEPATNTAGQTVQENPGIVPLLLPFVFLLNGPGEELLFRGVIQGRFREEFGAASAIVLASLMFAPAHIVSLVGSLQAAAITISVLTVPSLVFGAVYEYTDNFVVPALVHSVYNSILFGSVYVTAVLGEGSAALLVF